MCNIYVVVCAAQIVEPNPAAQAIRQEMDQLRKDFEARLAALEARLAALRWPDRHRLPCAGPGGSGADRRGAAGRGRRGRTERRAAGLR